MSKRNHINDYTDDPYTWGSYQLYGAIYPDNFHVNGGKIEQSDKFFAIETNNQKFLHSDTFQNGEIFLFCILHKLNDEPVYIYNVFLQQTKFYFDVFFRLISLRRLLF